MRYLIFALALFAPIPALALSCFAPQIERSFAGYDAAEEEYLVVHGGLTLDLAKLPKGMTSDPAPPRMTHVAAQLAGYALTGAGFTVPFDHDVTLEVACIGPWCGGAQTGKDILGFVRRGADGFALAIHPCGGAVFWEPEPAMLKRVQQCLTEKDCAAE